MKLLGFFMFMFDLGFAVIFGFVWGAKRIIDHLFEKGYRIIPPEEDTSA